jgi:calcium/calmodulin-dependent protein kinase kinase 2
VEENTADLVEPPTEEEMNRAITSNMSNLLVVMKAVKKFKGLLSKRRPEILESILGQETQIVQPPLPITKSAPLVVHKSQSVDFHDRTPIEQALAREGVHRNINPQVFSQPTSGRADAAVLDRALSKPVNPADHYAYSLKDQQSNPLALSQPLHASTMNETRYYGKGQAHDPLEEFLFLSVGPSQDYQDTDPPLVSESPPAAEGNIYEKAYHEEVERIRRSSRNTTLYLTRRVKNTQKYEDDDNMRGIDERGASSGFAKWLEKARARDRGEGDTASTMPKTSEGLKKLSEQALEKLRRKEADGKDGDG